MSQSSFSTIATDDRSESVDSLTNNANVNKPNLTKSGSLVMSLSMAQFYGQEETGDDDFGFSNPFVKELGLEDKKRLSARKVAIEEAAKVAATRPGLNGKQPSSRPGIGDKQLSSTQFTTAQQRAIYNKKIDQTAKAYKPAILQALEERRSVEETPKAQDSEADKTKRISIGKSMWGTVKSKVMGSKPKRDPKMVPPRQQEEVSW